MFCKERSERIRNPPWEMPRDAMAGEFCEDAGDGWKLNFRGSLSGFVLSRWVIFIAKEIEIERETEGETDRQTEGGGPGESDGSRNI